MLLMDFAESYQPVSWMGSETLLFTAALYINSDYEREQPYE